MSLSLSLYALVGAAVLPAVMGFYQPPPMLSFSASSNCTNSQTSCHNTTAVSTCCLNAPSGLLQQVQFWDTNPSEGPSNSWTIHGLWPNKCDGTYFENCDPSRAYKNITQILQAGGASSTVTYMDTYWISNDESDEAFWEHEWATHGTCVSTLAPSCYANYQPGQEVVDYFTRTVNLFKTLNTYETLSNAGIVPSSSTTYTLAQMTNALNSAFGAPVILQCTSGAVSEIFYGFNVQGSLQTGTFVPTEQTGSSTNCPSTGIKYLPKSG